MTTIYLVHPDGTREVYARTYVHNDVRKLVGQALRFAPLGVRVIAEGN